MSDRELAHALLVADDVLRREHWPAALRVGALCWPRIISDPRMPPNVCAIGTTEGNVVVEYLRGDRETP